MKFKILKPLSNKIKNSKKIYAFDIETKQKDYTSEKGLEYKHQEFLMGSVVGEDLQKVFWNKQEMQKYLISSKKLKDNLIFATNLDFDFNILYNDCDDLKKFNFIERNGSFIIITYKNKPKSTHRWKFLDTINYSRCGVEKLGQMLGISKREHPKCLGRIPDTMDERNELVEYNLTDSLISYKFGEFMRNFANNLKCKLKPTIASLGIDYWRRNYLKKDIFQERRSIIEDHYLGSIKGGRTENFKRGYFKDIFYYDFNSMYPSVCKDGTNNNGKYPDPSFVKTIDDGSVGYIESFEGISNVEIESPDTYIPLLGYHDKNGKLFFPKGIMKGWWCNIELRKAIELGYKIKKVNKVIYYDKDFVPFKDCVKSLYELRLSYQREGNKPMDQMIKTLMNGGLFGKFAQKINNKTEVYHIKNLYVKKNGECYIIKDEKKIVLYNFNIRGNFVFENIEIPMRIPIFIMPILASYTTAMARLKLFECMNKRNDNVIYCDTDSIVVNRKCYDSSNSLGQLKLEANIKEGIFCRPKQYYYTDGNKDTIRIKGVIKKALFNKQDFIDVLNNGVNYQRFTKIKESAIRKIPYGSIIMVNKSLGLEDDKRIWNDKFSFIEIQDSSPLMMIEGYSELEYRRLQLKVEMAYKKQQQMMFDKSSELYEERFADFFDSRGEDISKEEFFERETDYRDFE